MNTILYAYNVDNLSEKISYETLRKEEEIETSDRRIKEKYICGQCEAPVFIKRGLRKTPHFAHHKGYNANCSWFTNKTRSKGFISSVIHNGLQKGVLHQKLQNEFATALEKSGLTVSPPDSYFKLREDITHGRYPDIKADCPNGITLVFEIQIRPIQVPDIIERTNYYDVEGVELIWVLNEVDLGYLRSFQWDIIAANDSCIFSTDKSTRELTTNKNSLYLHANYPVCRLTQQCRSEITWSRKLICLSPQIKIDEVLLERRKSKVIFENYRKFHLSHVDTNISYPHSIAKVGVNTKTQDKLKLFLNKLRDFKSNKNYAEYYKSIPRMLERLTEITGRNIDTYYNSEEAEKLVSLFNVSASLTSEEIIGFKFSNKKQVLNYILDNEKFHVYLPVFLPSILLMQEFPKNFDNKLSAALIYDNEDPKLTASTFWLLTFLFPKLKKCMPYEE